MIELKQKKESINKQKLLYIQNVVKKRNNKNKKDIENEENGSESSYD